MASAVEARGPSSRLTRGHVHADGGAQLGELVTHRKEALQVRAAEAGLGAMFLGRVEHRFSRLRLVELELDVHVPQRKLHLACAKSALEIPRVRAVADLLVAEMGQARPNKRG